MQLFSFRTVSVDIYPYTHGRIQGAQPRFRTVSVDIYRYQKMLIQSTLWSFRTVSVDIYPLKELKDLKSCISFSYSIC